MMNGTDEGLQDKLYKVYLWGGLALVVINIFVSVLVFDVPSSSGPRAFLIIGGPLLLWFGGIVLFWWWVFLVKNNRELEKMAREPAAGVPDIQSLKSWNTLHQAMATNGGDRAVMVKQAKLARRPMLIWYGGLNLLALWICAPVTLTSLEIFEPPDYGMIVWVGGVVAWVILMIVITPILVGRGSEAGEKAYLAPLGLAVTSLPELVPNDIGMFGDGQKLIPDGPVIVEGERYGRLVHIETIDKHSLTAVQTTLPEFKIESKDGKLTADANAPDAITKAIKSLRKAKRWQGITLYAGPDGAAVQRESSGTNMWLYDLWLVEYLLDALRTK